MHNEMAKFVYDKVCPIMQTSKCTSEKANHANAVKSKEFRSLARSFPSMIQANGLGASLAFLRAKSNTDDTYYNIIQKWIQYNLKNDNINLMEFILEANSCDYRLYTDEIMNLCIWIKRFAEGMEVPDASA